MTRIKTHATICNMAHITYQSLMDTEAMFRALADRTRLRVARLLFIAGEATVCELVDALQVPQYSVSRHLSILRHAGIVSDRREGAWRYYSINPKADSFLDELLHLIGDHLQEELLVRDLALFKDRLALRVDGKCMLGNDA